MISQLFDDAVKHIKNDLKTEVSMPMLKSNKMLINQYMM